MHLLVTAGVTQVPIDRVRVITSVFSGRTGTRIALEANRRGHAVTLLTSAPQLVGEQLRSRAFWKVQSFRTYEELAQLLADWVPAGEFDAIVHSAAVSDYRVAGVYVRDHPNLRCLDASSQAHSDPQLEPLHLAGAPHAEAERADLRPDTCQAVAENMDKIPSNYPELWLRLVPTPKLVDRLRTDWGFRGILVKFKLEAGVSEEVLLQRAEESRRRSSADLMVANLLESVTTTAWLGPFDGQYRKLPRHQLASALLDAIEALIPSPNK